MEARIQYAQTAELTVTSEQWTAAIPGAEGDCLLAGRRAGSRIAADFNRRAR